MQIALRGRNFGLLAIVVAAGAALGGVGRSDARRSPSQHRPAAARASSSAVLTVERTASGRVIPTGFLGMSFEYWALEAYAGQDPRKVNPVLAQLLRNLAPGQSPVVRIGGVTTDRTWWPIAGAGRPPGIYYTLDHSRVAVMKALAKAVGGRLILGINLEANSTAFAAAEANAELAEIGATRIAAFELGNEPELYSHAYYRTPSGRAVAGRRAGYDFQRFKNDFARMRSALPPVPLAGPTTGARTFLSHLDELLASEPRLRLVTVHSYPLQACSVRPGVPRSPTIGELLSPVASSGLANNVVPDVAVAHAHHVALRIDEMNTVACGTAPQIRGTFATALWALDTLFSEAQVGVDGVNIHAYPGFDSQLFTVSHVNDSWRVFVEPEYYGMLMFAKAAPPGSRLLQLSGASGSLRAYATQAPDGRVRVALINDDTSRPQGLSVRLPGATAVATLEQLLAPSVRTTDGVTLAGQSFGRQTATGLLAGQRRTVSVTPAADAYTVRLPAASAAILTLR